MLLRDTPGRGAVALWLAGDSFDRFCCFVDFINLEQPLTCREVIGDAVALHDHWAPVGEIGRATVAEPADVKAAVDVFNDTELRERRADVVLVARVRGGRVEC